MQERENCSVADTTFFDRGLNLSLTSVCVGIGLAYCFMFMLLVAKAFLRPDGDSWSWERKMQLIRVEKSHYYFTETRETKWKTNRKGSSRGIFYFAFFAFELLSV